MAAVSQRDGVDLGRVHVLAEMVVQLPCKFATVLLLLAHRRHRLFAVLCKRLAQPSFHIAAQSKLLTHLGHPSPCIPSEAASDEQEYTGKFVHLIALVWSCPGDQMLG